MNANFVLPLSALLLLGLFIWTWALSVRGNNYSFVDVTWSLSFAPVAVLYAGLGDGWVPRRLTVALLVVLWSLRLGMYLWGRVAAHHPQEDPRYAVLREGWRGNLPVAFLGFFLAQALLVWLLTLPVYLICRNPDPYLSPWEISGFALWLIALAGEGLADAQLKRFKSIHPDRTAVCRVGLWRYSRHPNYFFQSLLWWALFLMALPASWGWTGIFAPLAMLFFLLRVTGIPLTEQLAVASKGEAYRLYQATTSAFIPLPPRSHPSTKS
jgi:steroid 5-alpha reductase family enzyme